MPEILFKSFHPLTLSLKRMKAKLYMEQQTARVVVLDYAVLLAAALVPAVQVALVVEDVTQLAAALAAAVVKVADLVVTQVVRRLVRVAAGMMDVPAVVLQHAELAREYAVMVVDIIVVQIAAGATRTDS